MMANDSTAELMALLEMRVEVGHECKEEIQPVGGPIHDVVYYVQDLRTYYKCIKVDTLHTRMMLYSFGLPGLL